MLGQVTTLAEELPFPPGVEDFFLPDFFGNQDTFWFTKITSLAVLAVVVIILFFTLSYRNPKLVPTKKQWLAEYAYGFVRDKVSVDMIGKEGVAFAPYLTCLFCFILVCNLFGVIPFLQMSPMSHIAFPAFLALISYLLFNFIGIKRFGFVKYMKHTLLPPAPWFILPLLIPIEFISTLIFRPLTLALRLFANMFAGHVILMVFTLGGFAMINFNALLFPVSIVSWAMAILLTFLETFIAALQAYVFVVLSTSYIQGALAEGH